jgi:hypothetical protein
MVLKGTVMVPAAIAESPDTATEVRADAGPTPWTDPIDRWTTAFTVSAQ